MAGVITDEEKSSVSVGVDGKPISCIVLNVGFTPNKRIKFPFMQKYQAATRMGTKSQLRKKKKM